MIVIHLSVILDEVAAQQVFDDFFEAVFCELEDKVYGIQYCIKFCTFCERGNFKRDIYAEKCLGETV